MLRPSERPHRRLFEDIDWSTERVLEQTLARAAEIGLASHLLPVWYDVDDVASLRQLIAELHAAGGDGYPAPYSAEMLRRFVDRL